MSTDSLLSSDGCLTLDDLKAFGARLSCRLRTAPNFVLLPLLLAGLSWRRLTERCAGVRRGWEVGDTVILEVFIAQARLLMLDWEADSSGGEHCFSRMGSSKVDLSVYYICGLNCRLLSQGTRV
jgi:hypothetical protein